MQFDQAKFAAALQLLAEAFRLPEQDADETPTPEAVPSVTGFSPPPAQTFQPEAFVSQNRPLEQTFVAPEPQPQESNITPIGGAAAMFSAPPVVQAAVAPTLDPEALRQRLKAALNKINTVKGQVPVVELLARYGVERFSQLQDHVLRNIVADAEALANG